MLSVFDLRDMVFYIRHHLNIFAYRMVYTTLLQVRDLIRIGSLKDFEIIAGKMDILAVLVEFIGFHEIRLDSLVTDARITAHIHERSMPAVGRRLLKVDGYILSHIKLDLTNARESFCPNLLKLRRPIKFRILFVMTKKVSVGEVVAEDNHVIVRPKKLFAILTASKKTDFGRLNRLPQPLQEGLHLVHAYAHIVRKMLIGIGKRNHAVVLMRSRLRNDTICPLDRVGYTALYALTARDKELVFRKLNGHQTHILTCEKCNFTFRWCQSAYIYQVMNTPMFSIET